MRIRTQLVLLAVGISVLPFVITSPWIFSGGGAKVPMPPLPIVFLPFALLVIAAVLSVLIARSLRISLDRLAGVASRLAEGDLDTPVDAIGREDVARLGAALEGLRVNLREERARRARLVMGVSHDFRTPIALIRGYAEALRDRVAPDRETEERYLGIIKDKAGQLEALVDDLLGYARMETDQRRGEQPRVELRAFFRDLAAEFAEDAAMCDRVFSYSDRAGGEILAPLDAGAAQRAFRNIFANAARYTEPGGRISMELSLSDGNLTVSLLDDGIGIAREELSSIFDPFFRGGNAGRRPGTGLGLSIVKSVIDSHGWRVFCTSEPGQGTRFTIVIPVS